MKENEVVYFDIFDELHIIFNDEVEDVKVVKLDNNVMVEFDENDAISNIVFPNFSKMLGTPINSYEHFKVDNVEIKDESIVISLKWSGPLINIRLSI